jgi:phosphonate transport system substrate-binding protein
MVDRRSFLKSAGAATTAGLAGLSGCLGDGGTETDGNGGGDGNGNGGTTGTATESTPTISFTLSPAESDVDIKKQYQPLFDYLESEANVSIDSTVAADYSAVLQSIKSDRTDLADAAPAIAIQAGKEDVAEVAGIRIAYGAAKYFSLITTMPDSDIEELGDLEGTTVAFADALSTSGSLFPLYALDQAGLDIGDAPKGEAVDFTGQWSDHSTARETLINRGDVMGAGTGAFSVADYVSKDDITSLSDQFKDISAEWPVGSKRSEQKLQTLHVSSPIPRAPILARSNWDEGVKSRCVDALLNATESDLIDEDAEEQLWFTGLQEGSVSDYDPVQEVIDTLGISLGQ